MFPARTTSESPLPHNLDAERSVLGACLLHGDAVPSVAAILQPGDFYLPRHAVIFGAILAAYSANRTADPIVVGEELKSRGRLAEAGGHEQLLDLVESVLTAAGVEYHADIVREHARRRGLAALARDIEQRIADGQQPGEIESAIEHHLRQAAARGASSALTPGDILAQWGVEGPLVHVPTGLPSIDALTGGGPPFGARCYILGAPDAGKTAFIVQIADYFLEQGLVVGFLAIDEEPGDVLMRFLQRRGYSRRDCEQRDKRDLFAMAAKMADVGLFLYGPEHTIEAAADDLARRAKKLNRRAAFFIDSIQTARCAYEPDGASLHVAVTLRTYAIRVVTSANGFVTYATSEMGRGAYKSPDKADRVSDLAAAKESGAIEYSARFMVSLRSVTGESDLIEASVAKNKFGPRTREGEPGLHLRLDRERQVLTEDLAYVGATAADREDKKAALRNEEAVADAAVLALVIVDEPGIRTTDADEAFRRRAGCGTRRWKPARSTLRHAIVEVPGPRNRVSLYLDGTKVPDEVLARVPVDQRPKVLASRIDTEIHRVPPSSTRVAGAPHREQHHHPLRSRGGAARGCSSCEEPAPPPGAGGAQEGEETS